MSTVFSKQPGPAAGSSPDRVVGSPSRCRAGRRVAMYFTDPSLTKQAYKDECDINVIMTNWEKSGVLTHTPRTQGEYRDLGSSFDYHAACNQALAAQAAFDSLSGTVRARFSNDPGRFLDFVQDPRNIPEMISLGLATAEEAPAATPDSKGGASAAVRPAKAVSKAPKEPSTPPVEEE